MFVYMFRARRAVQALKYCISIEYMLQFKGVLFIILSLEVDSKVS